VRANRIDDLRMPVTDVEDAEAAEAIDIFAAVDVREDVAAIGPLDGSVERALRAGLAIFEESGIDVSRKPSTVSRTIQSACARSIAGVLMRSRTRCV